MKTTEEQIRDLLTSEELRAPLAADAMPGIHRGIARDKRRRTSALVAATIAVAAAITVPIVVHGSSQHPAKTPTATRPSKPVTPQYVGLTRISTLAPTWLPAGLVETGREAQVLSTEPGFPAFAERTFSPADPRKDGGVGITDYAASAHIPKTGTVPVEVSGRTGRGWATTDPKGYEIQVKWKAGHWLDVTADTKATALRIGNSIVEHSVAVNVPITFRKSSTVHAINISGSRKAPFVTMLGSHLYIEINQTRDSEPTTRALGHGLYAHIGSLAGRKSYPKAEYVAIAESFRIHGKLDFPWLGKRP